MQPTPQEFLSLSQSPGVSIDAETGEIVAITKNRVSELSGGVDGAILSVVGHAPRVGDWGEKMIKLLVNGFKKVVDAPYDFLNSRTCIEVKTSRVGNASIIKENQLKELAELEGYDRYYSLVFYRTKKGKKVSEITPDEVEDALTLEAIFIFPIEYIIYFYNSHSGKNIAITSGKHQDSFKKIHIKQAHELFALDTGEIFEKREVTAWGKQIYIIEYRGKPLHFNKTFA